MVRPVDVIAMLIEKSIVGEAQNPNSYTPVFGYSYTFHFPVR